MACRSGSGNSAETEFKHDSFSHGYFLGFLWRHSVDIGDLILGAK